MSRSHEDGTLVPSWISKSKGQRKPQRRGKAVPSDRLPRKEPLLPAQRASFGADLKKTQQ